MMKKFVNGALALMVVFFIVACSGSGRGGNGDFPRDFAERSDEHALDTMIFHDFEICLR